jgi:hypothetical protein
VDKRKKKRVGHISNPFLKPYQGRTLRGMVRETWLRGERIFSRDQGFDSQSPAEMSTCLRCGQKKEEESGTYLKPVSQGAACLAATMLFRNKCSPYQGRTLRGMVRETWLRGERIFSRESKPWSRLKMRSPRNQVSRTMPRRVRPW